MERSWTKVSKHGSKLMTTAVPLICIFLGSMPVKCALHIWIMSKLRSCHTPFSGIHISHLIDYFAFVEVLQSSYSSIHGGGYCMEFSYQQTLLFWWGKHIEFHKITTTRDTVAKKSWLPTASHVYGCTKYIRNPSGAVANGSTWSLLVKVSWEKMQWCTDMMGEFSIDFY